MYRFFAEQSACKGEYISIGGADWNHMKNVLRLKTGEQVTVSDGSEREYICEIAEYLEDEARLRVLDILDSAAELIIQKAVELGAVRIVPVMTKRSIVKLDEKKAAKRIERYNAIALSAAKQSKRSRVPVVEPVMTYAQALKDAEGLEMNLIPYEDARGIQYAKEIIHQVSGKKSLGIFIGPEGGFEEAEVEAARKIGAECITLGHRILRTETAGMAVLSILMFELEQD